jgi:hypothetical protein
VPAVGHVPDGGAGQCARRSCTTEVAAVVGPGTREKSRPDGKRMRAKRDRDLNPSREIRVRGAPVLARQIGRLGVQCCTCRKTVLHPPAAAKTRLSLLHALADAATGRAAQEGTARPDVTEQAPRGPWAEGQDLKDTRQTGQ